MEAYRHPWHLYSCQYINKRLESTCNIHGYFLMTLFIFLNPKPHAESRKVSSVHFSAGLQGRVYMTNEIL